MPESYWMEADWTHNLRVADNYVDVSFGGILVGLIRSNDLGSGEYLNHGQITITNNTVTNANYAPILVTSAKDVVVGGNTIQDCLCGKPNVGQGFRCDMHEPAIALIGYDPEGELVDRPW